MRVHICNYHGMTVATSRDLRGILDFARKHPVDVVTLKEAEHGGAIVTFYFDTHAPWHQYHAETQWADPSVALDWLHTRRSWSIERITLIGPLWDRLRFTATAKAILRSGTIITRRL